MIASKFISITSRILSIGVTTALWYLTYKYIYKQVNDESENESKNNDDYSDCYKVMRMKIPSYSKGAIIGKNGSTIKKIQEKTKTTIKFVTKNVKSSSQSDQKGSTGDWSVDLTKDSDAESFEVLLIRGLTLRVMEAEKEVKTVIESVPIFCEGHMMIDNRFVGKIIGKKGENIRRLKDCHKVQIDIDKTTNPQRQITLRGIIANISECKSEIIKIIDAEILKENRFHSLPNNRQKTMDESSAQNSSSAVDVTKNVDELSAQNSNGVVDVTKKMEELDAQNSNSVDNVVKNMGEFRQSYVTYPGGLNEKIYIYVSSVVDCGKFYAHIINDEISTLENLIEEMTEHFAKNTMKCETSFNVGDILAGFYEPSQTWQRVKIIGIEDNLFEIIYLDYGDCTKVKIEDLKTFEPNSKYLELPFQALRLMTHGIQPCGDYWTENDINEFESLTKVGCSYKIAAILKKKNLLNFEVQLIDEESDTDIAQKLISNGRAKESI